MAMFAGAPVVRGYSPHSHRAWSMYSQLSNSRRKGTPRRRGRLQHVWASEDGQAVVEFALVSPLVLLLILGLVEFSRAWNVQQVLTDTARESLRNSVVANSGFSYGAMTDLVHASLRRAALDPARADIYLDGWKAGTGTPARIRIDYEYEFGFFGPFIDWATGDMTLALSTSFVMRNE